jgi:hypothetical protein
VAQKIQQIFRLAGAGTEMDVGDPDGPELQAFSFHVAVFMIFPRVLCRHPVEDS